MNFFREKSDYIGRLETEEDNSFYSFFCLAEQIRSKMGTKGYLLDSYLSSLFKQFNSTYITEIGDDGLDAALSYQKICVSIIDGTKKENDSPLYFKTLSTAIGSIKNTAYQENCTRMELLFASMADDFYEDAVSKYIDRQLFVIDIVELREMYNQISNIVGESMMETLTLKLKQKFLLVPPLSIFAQGFINDFIDRLTTRDIETNKQIFQLLLDRIAENKV